MENGSCYFMPAPILHSFHVLLLFFNKNRMLTRLTMARFTVVIYGCPFWILANRILLKSVLENKCSPVNHIPVTRIVYVKTRLLFASFYAFFVSKGNLYIFYLLQIRRIRPNILMNRCSPLLLRSCFTSAETKQPMHYFDNFAWAFIR